MSSAPTAGMLTAVETTPPVSAYDVVNNLNGLSNIQVSLNSPSNPSSRLDVNPTELVTIRNIYVNGLTN